MIDFERLQDYVQKGLVDRIPDPEGYPLCIYNYTFEATKANNWDETLLACRGLVVGDDKVVYARPFKKFFNIDEHATTKRAILPIETPQLAEKLDGSLIIIFWHPYKNKWVAITRGCWTSDQANWVNNVFDLKSHMAKLEDAFPTGDTHTQTYCFELIAPWNRIVVAYTVEKLICLGVISNDDGVEATYKDTYDWCCRHTGWEPVKYIEQPLESIDLNVKFKNDEGYVALYSNGLRVKLKYAEYFIIHAMMTGMSVRKIWEQLKDDIEVDLNSMPDEFLAWYEQESGKLKVQYDKVELAALRAFTRVDPTLTRKEKALLWKDEPHVVQSVCFGLLNQYSEADVRKIIWKTLKPTANQYFRKDSDDARETEG